MQIGYIKAIVSITIFIISLIVARITSHYLQKKINESIEDLKIDPTRYKFLKNAISLIIYLVALTIIIYQYPSLRAFAVGLFAGAGIIAAIIGFASQQAFSNMVSGVFIVLFRPFRVGDWVKIGSDKSGIVLDITLRHTIIRDFENKRIIIPNSIISSEIIVNSTIEDQKIRRHIEFGISYDSDIDKAIAIIQEEAMKHPNFIDNRTKEEKKKNEPAVLARLMGFGDSSINIRAYVWSTDPAKSFDLYTDLNLIIKKRFDKEGIEIPFPYRTIVYKKDLVQ
ncbi:MAG: mechanosensitive ion channel [Candidatus Marinimicrobia bacterium]|nr:mechanosensitive ion channel [Candidatus Neomarinimicrobiota bacterium]